MTNPKAPRKWLGITFACCQTYGRSYKEDNKDQYKAQCPKCGRWMLFIVGPKGTSSRFFEVG